MAQSVRTVKGFSTPQVIPFEFGMDGYAPRPSYWHSIVIAAGTALRHIVLDPANSHYYEIAQEQISMNRLAAKAVAESKTYRGLPRDYKHGMRRNSTQVAAGRRVRAAGNEIALGAGRMSIACGDLDGDGRRGLVVIAEQDRKVRWYGNQTGGAGEPALAAKSCLKAKGGGDLVAGDVRVPRHPPTPPADAPGLQARFPHARRRP